MTPIEIVALPTPMTDATWNSMGSKTYKLLTVSRKLEREAAALRRTVRELLTHGHRIPAAIADSAEETLATIEALP